MSEAVCRTVFSETSDGNHVFVQRSDSFGLAHEKESAALFLLCDWPAGLHNHGPVLPSAVTAFPSLLLSRKAADQCCKSSITIRPQCQQQQPLLANGSAPTPSPHPASITATSKHPFSCLLFYFMFGNLGAPPAGGKMLMHSYRSAIRRSKGSSQ